jgi:3D (Asp-Asp-Asp) domain-containing protein
MFTKSVVAYALGGAIIGAPLLSGPPLADAHPQKIIIKKQTGIAFQRKSIKQTGLQCSGQHRGAILQARQPDDARAKAESSQITGSPDASNKKAAARLGTFAVTAYTHYRRPRGGERKTAAGLLPRAGRTVAVDPCVIPLGSRIHIEGVGERIAEDTGKKIKGRKLDLFLPSAGECRRFGIRQQEVYLVAE